MQKSPTSSSRLCKLHHLVDYVLFHSRFCSRLRISNKRKGIRLWGTAKQLHYVVDCVLLHSRFCGGLGTTNKRKGTGSWGTAGEVDDVVDHLSLCRLGMIMYDDVVGSAVDCVLLCSRLCMIMLLCRKGTRSWGVAREPDSVVDYV